MKKKRIIISLLFIAIILFSIGIIPIFSSKWSKNETEQPSQNQVVNISEENEVPLSSKNTKTVNTIQDLLNYKGKSGDYVSTLGFHEVNDGGGATYLITKYSPKPDNMMYFALPNNLFAVISAENGSIKVEQLGAYGDGIHDDSAVLQKALTSPYSKIVLSNKTYLCNNTLSITSNNKTIVGNGAILTTGAKYKSSKDYFLLIKAKNINISRLNVTSPQDISSRSYLYQLRVVDSSNVCIDSCSFSIPSKVNFGGTNVDLYSGWHGITIKNCTLLNNNGNTGGCIWIRDIHKKGSDSLTFTNNNLSKISHDEILAIYYGSVKDLEIKNNDFKTEESTLSKPSSVVFTIGSGSSTLCQNVTFENNKIDCQATFSLVQSQNASNVSFSNNSVKYTQLSEKTVYLFTQPENKAANISSFKIENNTIQVTSTVDHRKKVFRVFNLPATLSGNSVVSDSSIPVTSFIAKSTITSSGNNTLKDSKTNEKY